MQKYENFTWSSDSHTNILTDQTEHLADKIYHYNSEFIIP